MGFKQKALLYNFFAFAAVFLLLRFGLPYVLAINPLYVSLVSAVLAMILAPKFAVARVDGSEKLMMKWIFFKGFKEL
ncbi:hypothetical protein DZC72_15030 [Maribacter algicola]|uniref:Uncharacterized protein n=1 Tax=Maribacter algicola TaxID=2498892 RepID=A0A426RJ20_9FLAO|nr:hypothetical protein DZC72_15030 [Maribacter algicola]